MQLDIPNTPECEYLTIFAFSRNSPIVPLRAYNKLIPALVLEGNPVRRCRIVSDIGNGTLTRWIENKCHVRVLTRPCCVGFVSNRIINLNYNILRFYDCLGLTICARGFQVPKWLQPLLALRLAAAQILGLAMHCCLPAAAAHNEYVTEVSSQLTRLRGKFKST